MESLQDIALRQQQNSPISASSSPSGVADVHVGVPARWSTSTGHAPEPGFTGMVFQSTVTRYYRHNPGGKNQRTDGAVHGRQAYPQTRKKWLKIAGARIIRSLFYQRLERLPNG